jgi:hypothetical protein
VREVRGGQPERRRGTDPTQDNDDYNVKTQEKMADIDFDVDALEDMAYRDIQALCKRIGIRANQKVCL